MNYVLETCYGDHNEWSDEIEYYLTALDLACKKSRLAGVSEVRVWLGDEVVDVYVDGEVHDPDEEQEDEWVEYDEPHYSFDEVGYDPYTGGYDADL